MRIHLLSDLHLDHDEDAPVLPLPACDLRLVLGDLCEYRHRTTIAAEVLTQLADGGAPVAVVLGNHDHYHYAQLSGGHTREERVDGWRDACAAAGAKLLDCEAIEVGGVRVLGCTWWSAMDWLDGSDHPHRAKFPSDIAYMRHAAEFGISDFRRIRSWGIAEHLARHEVESAWLAEELAAGQRKGHPCVVATHFLPHRAAIDAAYLGSSLNAYFTSHRPDLVRMARAWLFGHTHRHVDVVAEGVRLIANPRGYPRERSRFRSDLVVEV